MKLVSSLYGGKKAYGWKDRTFESLNNPLLPSQLEPEEPATPERRLWMGVLLEAMDCAGGKVVGWGNEPDKVNARDRAVEDAKKWFRSTSRVAGGFVWCCEQVGVEGEDVLRLLGRRGVL